MSEKKSVKYKRIKKYESEHILRGKVTYTCLIMLVYIVCRCIPLYGLDSVTYEQSLSNPDNFLLQAIGGDIYKSSIFALGIAPYITGSILVQMVAAVKKIFTKAPSSPRKQSAITVLLVLAFAIGQAYGQVSRLPFIGEGNLLLYAKFIAGIEMVTGALLIMKLASRNKKYGVGGQTSLFFVNIVDGISKNVVINWGKTLIVPMIIAIVCMMIMVLMENVEVRIPVQRIAIQSIYSDKNYMAIKANPIGVMPVMFASAVFMLPQLIIELLAKVFPNKLYLQWLNTQMNLNCMTGIITYLVMLYVLTFVFSILFIDPSNLAEQFLKSGDSIVNLRSGPPTKKYIYSTLRNVCFFSATVMSICVGVPLFLKYFKIIESSLYMLPTSIMMLAGIFSTLYQEYLAVKSFDEYAPFI